MIAPRHVAEEKVSTWGRNNDNSNNLAAAEGGCSRVRRIFGGSEEALIFLGWKEERNGE